jgi:predicted MFS family arabinose efflux permease
MGAPPTLRTLLSRPEVRASYLMTAVTMMAGFILIPNLSAFIQSNLGYPRARLGWLYLYAGIASFATTQVGGRLVDRFGSLRVGSVGVAVLSAASYVGFWRGAAPVVPLFVIWMIALGLRNVAYNTLTSKVPSAGERARFLSFQSSVQHAASAAGAFLSSRLLTSLPDGALAGMPRVVAISIGLTLCLPWLLYRVERQLRPRP